MEHSGDNSAEALEDQRDDLRNELIELHATLKDLNNNMESWTVEGFQKEH
jgi:hypothetical protein